MIPLLSLFQGQIVFFLVSSAATISLIIILYFIFYVLNPFEVKQVII